MLGAVVMDYEKELKGVTVPRFGWALTGSGHFFKESLEIMRRLPHLDVFVSRAAAEVIRMYKQNLELPADVRIFKDTTASAARRRVLLRRLSHLDPGARDVQHRCQVRGCEFRQPRDQCVRCVVQAGKCHVPSIVFACDTAPEINLKRPREWSRSIRGASILKTPKSSSRSRRRPSSRRWRRGAEGPLKPLASARLKDSILFLNRQLARAS